MGFGIVLKLLMEDKRLSRDAKMIYAYFRSFAGSGNIAFPSMKQCNTKSTLKNFDEEEIDFKAIMAVHNKMTAKDIFKEDYIDDPVMI